MIIKSFGFDVQLPIRIFEDNQVEERLAKDYGCQKRTKHIDVRYHYVRLLRESGFIAVEYKRSEDQLADMLTKNLPTGTFQKLLNQIMWECNSLTPPARQRRHKRICQIRQQITFLSIEICNVTTLQQGWDKNIISVT